MSSQRPFFANFLAAFRAHSSPTFNAKSSPSSSGAAVSASGSTTTTHLTTTPANTTSHPSNTGSNPRSISTKATAFQQGPPPVRSSSPEPISYSSNNPGAQSASLSRSPNTAATSASHYVGMSMSPPSAGASTPLSYSRGRRGSDSSSSSGGTSGFKDILGPEKWYIGGRTPSGEEKFYRLGMVTSPGMAFGGAGGGSGKRVRSLDRLSL